MEVHVEPGKYVVAVSGGVDSVCLLDMLSKQPGLQLVVAHFDHGIRSDSAEDSALVEGLATGYGLKFVSASGHLGPTASEATAREARYAFLRRVMKEQGADGIITAHHEDDVLETAIINMLRGTGRKGLTALGSKGDIIRPLLHVSKADILAYAHKQGLKWHDDSTNSDERYLRNYVRQKIVPRLDETGRKALSNLIVDQRAVNDSLDKLLSERWAAHAENLQRSWIAQLPHDASKEVMAAWLRANGLTNFDRATLERAVVGAKTARSGQKIALKENIFLEVKGTELALTHMER